MISVILSANGSDEALARTLASLVPAVTGGQLREVTVLECGKGANTAATSNARVVAEVSGCEFLGLDGAKGSGLKTAARQSGKGAWLLFLEAGSVLEAGWQEEAAKFIERAERAGASPRHSATFTLGLDDFSLASRVRELAASARTRLVGMPTRAQGLLISRKQYDALGGHRDVDGLEDLDLYRRIGLTRVHQLRPRAVVFETGTRPQGNRLRRLVMMVLRV